MGRLSFHSFSDVKTNRGKLWIVKIRRDPGHNFVVNQNIKVCLLHFIVNNYISGDAMYSKRHVLKQLLFQQFSPRQLKSIYELLLHPNWPFLWISVVTF